MIYHCHFLFFICFNVFTTSLSFLSLKTILLYQLPLSLFHFWYFEVQFLTHDMIVCQRSISSSNYHPVQFYRLDLVSTLINFLLLNFHQFCRYWLIVFGIGIVLVGIVIPQQVIIYHLMSVFSIISRFFQSFLD